MFKIFKRIFYKPKFEENKGVLEVKNKPKVEEVKNNKIQVPHLSYKPSPGVFLYKQTSGNWKVESCRESFHSASFSPEGKSNFDEFFFASNNKIENVVEFMKIVECASHAEESIIISETNLSTIIHIKMPKWWADNPVRRNVLTAFLRASLKFKEHSGEGFEEAINSNEYLKNTRKAVDVFLSGGSRIKNKFKDFGGWYDTFRNKNVDPHTILVKIKRKPKEKKEKQ